MSDVQQQQPAPGWYPDGSGQMRWWDGTQWGATAAPVILVPAPRQPANGTAVASMVLGIIGVLIGWMIITLYLVVPMTIIGLVLGIVGYNRAKTLGRGRGMASWGIVLCSLPLILLGAAAIVSAAGNA